jgi:hypothetical protein
MPRISVNGVMRDIDADPQMPLLWALRDLIGLTGTKFGCGIGACGACTVHMDGEMARACLTSLADAEGACDRHHRGAQSRWYAPGSARLDGAQRAAMRVLSAGADHPAGGAAEADARAHRSGDPSALQIAMGRNDIVEGVGAVWADVENALANGIEQVGVALADQVGRDVEFVALPVNSWQRRQNCEFATLESHFGRHPRSRRWEARAAVERYRISDQS